MKQKALPQPGSLGAWILAIRPKTLTAGATPVIVGGAMAQAWFYAGSHGDPEERLFLLTGFGSPSIRLLAALVVALGIQIGTNLVNDIADHLRGADTIDRLGPPRASNLGLLSPRAVTLGAVVSFAAAAAAGLWLASVTSWLLLIPGGLALACGVLYTVGPVSIAYLGLGEIFVLAFFGVFATAGTTFVLTGVWVGDAIIAGLAIGLLAVGILEANNIRDIPTDGPVGKRTLAVRVGDRAARWIYAGVIMASFVLGIWSGPWPSTLLLLLCLPLAWWAIKPVLRGAGGRELIRVLQMNSLLELMFGLVLSVSVILWTQPIPMGSIK